jgi:hypothetical protein
MLIPKKMEKDDDDISLEPYVAPRSFEAQLFSEYGHANEPEDDAMDTESLICPRTPDSGSSLSSSLGDIYSSQHMGASKKRKGEFDGEMARRSKKSRLSESPIVRRRSFGSILTHPEDLGIEEKAVGELFKPATGLEPTFGGGLNLVNPTVTMVVEYLPPDAPPNTCQACVNSGMSFAALVARVTNNMVRRGLVNKQVQLKFSLLEFRSIVIPYQFPSPSAAENASKQHRDFQTGLENMIWIRAIPHLADGTSALKL